MIFKLKLYLTTSTLTSVKATLADPKWKQAMEDEYDALMKNSTWSLLPFPSNREAIGCKWIFKIKENPYSSINSYKAMLGAKGYHEQQGCGYNATFSLVVKVFLLFHVIFQGIKEKTKFKPCMFTGYYQREN